MAIFDDVTGIEPVAPDRWAVELRDEMGIVNGHPNGGYLLVLLGKAGVAAVGQEGREVIAASATYVAAPSMGPAEVHTEVLRRGRTASQVRARLVQDGAVCVDALLSVGTVGDGDPDHGEALPPEVPTLEECRAAVDGLGLSARADAPLAQVIRFTFDPACLGWLRGEPSGSGELRAYLELTGDRPFDPGALLFAVDALPPATFEIVMAGWVPTLSLTAYVRARPAPGPLLVRFRAGVITGGLVDETCEVWDATGRLVAQATQLAAIRLP